MALVGLSCLAACGDDAARPGSSQGPGGSGGDGAGGDGAAPCEAPDACSYGAPDPWREPIGDYLHAAEVSGFDMLALQRSITDLMVFDDRLYFGYGDATLNVGSTIPIQIRYFDDPEAEHPAAEPIATTEEVISQYRRYGDLLIVPGVDATEDGFLGNVLTKPRGGAFTRHRSVYGGVHVHDAARFKGAIYACGSGALDLETWNTGIVRSWLWRSVDGGHTWDALAEVPNVEVGDRRWVQMAPVGDELLLFGYRTNPSFEIAELVHAVFDGASVSPSGAASEHFVLATDPFDTTTAIVRGVYVMGETRFETLVTSGSDGATPVVALAGLTALDVFIVEPGLALVLAAAGDEHPQPAVPTLLTVYATRDLDTFTPLVSFESDTWPTALGWWRGALYVGLDDGRVLRAVGEPPK